MLRLINPVFLALPRLSDRSHVRVTGKTPDGAQQRVTFARVLPRSSAVKARAFFGRTHQPKKASCSVWAAHEAWEGV